MLRSWLGFAAIMIFGLGGTIPPAGSPLADIGLAPSVRLIDSEAKPFDLETLRGKAVVVSFVFTTCDGTCPMTSAAMARTRDLLADRGLWGKSVEFVSISLDPEHDTPNALKTYGRIYEVDPSTWHFLTGSADDVGRVVKSWDMWAKRTPEGVLDHPSRIFLIDPNGHRREIYNLATFSPEVLADDVRGLLDEAGRR